MGLLPNGNWARPFRRINCRAFPAPWRRLGWNSGIAWPQPISGRVSLRGPQNWYFEPRTAEFRLDPGETWKLPLSVALPNDVVGGRQMVRLDFAIQADRFYRFAMVPALGSHLGRRTLRGPGRSERPRRNGSSPDACQSGQEAGPVSLRSPGSRSAAAIDGGPHPARRQERTDVPSARWRSNCRARRSGCGPRRSTVRGC